MMIPITNTKVNTAKIIPNNMLFEINEKAVKPIPTNVKRINVVRNNFDVFVFLVAQFRNVLSICYTSSLFRLIQ